MGIKKVFKSHMSSINYVTSKGRTCSFVEGRYLTDVPEEVAELTEIVNSKSNPHIYIDPNEKEFDTETQDRVSKAARDAAIAELEKINKEKMEAAQKDGKNAASGSTGAVLGADKTMGAATLLGVANSATLGKNAPESNQK